MNVYASPRRWQTRRTRLVLCKCERAYLNSPFATDNTKRGHCDLCSTEREMTHDESFSAWLDATGDSLVPDFPEQPLTSGDISEALQVGFKMKEVAQ